MGTKTKKGELKMHKKLFTLAIFLTSAYANASLYSTKYYCQNNHLVKCFIGPYAYECEYTGKKCEDVLFSSIGVGYKCYQDREGPEVQAKKDAEIKAQNKCGTQTAYMVSDYKYLQADNVCILKMSADFVCIQDLDSVEL